MNEDKPKLALRVFKRSAKHLILLWRRQEGADPLKAEITFQDLGAERSKPVKVDSKHIHIDEPLDVEDSGRPEPSINAETVVCLIHEKNAGLDPNSLYYVKLRYGGEEQGIRLTPSGVFPSHEREDRQKNVHLMVWDDKGQCWRKACGVKGPNNQWFVGVAVVGDVDQDGKSD